MRTVFIVIHNGGYDGKSEPLKGFESQALADLYVEAANTHAGGFEVYPLDILSLEDFALPTKRTTPNDQ